MDEKELNEDALLEAACYRLVGKFDPNEAEQRLRNGAFAFLLALHDMGGSFPDDPDFMQEMAHSAGLQAVGTLQLICEGMVRKGWLTYTAATDPARFSLTLEGSEQARRVKHELGLD